MHKFFELISVGEEIIQEGTKFDALKARGKAAGSKIKGKFDWAKGKGKAGAVAVGSGLARAGTAGGRGIARFGKKAGSAIEAGAGKTGQFVAKHPKKFGALGIAGAGAAAFGGGKTGSKFSISRKQESTVEEGVRLDKLLGRARGARAAIGRGASKVAEKARTFGKDVSSKTGRGIPGFFSTMKASKGGYSELSRLKAANTANPMAKYHAGAAGVAGIGAGVAGRHAYKKKHESALQEGPIGTAFIAGAKKVGGELLRGGRFAMRSKGLGVGKRLGGAWGQLGGGAKTALGAAGGLGVGGAAFKQRRRFESELPELSANLQETFLKNLLKKR